MIKDTKDITKIIFPKEETQSVQEHVGGGGKVDFDSYETHVKQIGSIFGQAGQVARIFIMLLFITKEDLGKESLRNTNVESVNWFNLSEKTI